MRLAQSFPDLAGKLKGGTTGPTAAKAYICDYFIFYQVDLIFHSLLADTWPIPVQKDFLGMNPKEYQLFFQFRHAFYTTISHISGESRIDVGDYEILAPMLSKKRSKEFAAQAFDKTCLEFERRIDNQYFEGKKGTFLKQSPLFGVDDWVEQVYENAHNAITLDEGLQLYEAFEKLEIATERIAVGVDEVRTKCWECGCAPIKTQRGVCSVCTVPLYCGKACQVAAWAGGHENNCQELKKRRIRLKTSLDVVLRAHQHGPYEGVYIDLGVSYRLARLHDIDWAIQSDLKLQESGVDGPKMEYFFKHFAAILGGKWWVYSDSCTPKEYAEAVDKVAARMKTNPTILLMKNFDFIGLTLCYDLEMHAGLMHPEVSTKAIEALAAGGGAGFSKRYLGVSMPREIFLEYYTCERPCSKELAWSLRKQTKWDALKQYHNKHNK